jgi:hypothetical protein
VLGQAGHLPVHHPPGSVKLENIGLTQKGCAVQAGSLHRGRLIGNALLQM